MNSIHPSLDQQKWYTECYSKFEKFVFRNSTNVCWNDIPNSTYPEVDPQTNYICKIRNPNYSKCNSTNQRRAPCYQYCCERSPNCSADKENDSGCEISRGQAYHNGKHCEDNGVRSLRVSVFVNKSYALPAVRLNSCSRCSSPGNLNQYVTHLRRLIYANATSHYGDEQQIPTSSANEPIWATNKAVAIPAPCGAHDFRFAAGNVRKSPRLRSNRSSSWSVFRRKYPEERVANSHWWRWIGENKEAYSDADKTVKASKEEGSSIYRTLAVADAMLRGCVG